MELDDPRILKSLNRLEYDGVSGDLRSVIKTLRSLYSEQHRHYHTLRHISAGLEEIDFARSWIKKPVELETAWYFHDAIYNPKEKDNEERSSWLAHALLAQNGVSRNAIIRIADLILATKHLHKVEDHDAKIIVDVDLSILGKDIEKYREYSKAIRQEYSYVDKEIFAINRIRILKMFLDRENIYQTEIFKVKYESKARANIAQEIDELSHRG